MHIWCSTFNIMRHLCGAQWKINFFVSFIVLQFSVFLVLCQKEEGDDCINHNGFSAKCVHLTNCEPALKSIDHGVSPKYCNDGTETNFNALVCCTRFSQNMRQRISFEKCKEYYPDLYKEVVIFAAVNGKLALSQEYRHMALVGYGEKDDINWLCGGSLISEKFVLTAAHCIYSRYGEPDWVRLGELDTASTTDDADPQDFAIIRSIAHPTYQVPSEYHDIGVLELEKAVKFSAYIKPACLYQSQDTSSIYQAVATGWGHTAFGGAPSSHLIEVWLAMVNNTHCNKFFRTLSKSKLASGVVDDSQICAGGNEGRDTCQGDSGGPLQIRKPQSKIYDKAYEVIGITSFGLACGLPDTPGIYTRISYYIDWIEKVVWP